jgi:hypothetical protein
VASVTSKGRKSRQRAEDGDELGQNPEALVLEEREQQSVLTADLSWMLWTAIGIGGIWVAVLLLSLLAPDLVSGSEQDHLPVAAFTTWFWGGVGTLVFLWVMGRLRAARGGSPSGSGCRW